MRYKIPDEYKKDKTAVSIDNKLLELLENYLAVKGISNKSKYIESLILRDMENRGEKIEKKL